MRSHIVQNSGGTTPAAFLANNNPTSSAQAINRNASDFAQQLVKNPGAVGLQLGKSLLKVTDRVVSSVSHSVETLTGQHRYEFVDVLVIGGGLSGLTVAEGILEKSSKLRVTVLEANDRLGGRTHTNVVNIGGRQVAIDEGGMWLSPNHNAMLALVARFPEIKTVQQHYDDNKKDKHVLIDSESGLRKPYSGEIPPYSILSLLELQYKALNLVDRMANSINVHNPTDCPNFQAWDKESVASFLERKFYSKWSRKAIDLVVVTLCGAQSSQVSLFYFLYMIRTCGVGIKRVCDVRGGAQDRRIVGGSEQLSNKIANVLTQVYENAKIEQSARVIEIRVKNPDSAEHCCLAICADGRRFVARIVVIACNPSVFIQRVPFTPRLPTRLVEFSRRTFSGSYSKAIVIYDTPWWREAGFTGYAINTSPTREQMGALIVDYCGCQTTEAPLAPDVYALVIFFCGDVAIQNADLTMEERKKSIVETLKLVFGPPLASKAENVAHYQEKMWHKDDVLEGCPAVVYPPGQFAEYNALKCLGTPLAYSRDASSRPLIFWSSTDTSTVWTGYMEGAVVRGKEVARQVTRTLVDLAKRTNIHGAVDLRESFGDSEKDAIVDEGAFLLYSTMNLAPQIGLGDKKRGGLGNSSNNNNNSGGGGGGNNNGLRGGRDR
jgi:monoamine oxidase